MGYYNQALTDYVGKICDVERELYTTQRLIANLDYQMQRLGHPREVDPPEPTDGGNPFVQNGGWYMVFLLGIPISGVVRSISLGIVIAIALGVFGTVWGNIYQRAADREIRNEKWAKYDSAVAADKKRVEKERAYRKQLQSEKELPARSCTGNPGWRINRWRNLALKNRRFWPNMAIAIHPTSACWRATSRCWSSGR